MKRFMGMMPRNEIAKEQHFKDHCGLTIIVQAGPNGWTILWADHSSNYKDTVATVETNWQAALNFLTAAGFTQLTPFESSGER